MYKKYIQQTKNHTINWYLLLKNNKIYKSNSEIFSKTDEGMYDRFAPQYYHAKYTSIDGNTAILGNENGSNFLTTHLFNKVPPLISFI